MKILALDTSTEACSAAIYQDGIVEQRFELAPREHTKLILPMIDELLANAELKISQLDALAFGCGPGSFTGVRIATGIAQGLAFGADLPVVPVSTLASVAQAVYEEHQHQHVLAAIDARMGEVYWSQYQLGEDGIMVLTGEELVIKPEQVSAIAGINWVGAGTAWDVYAEQLNQAIPQAVSNLYADVLPQSSMMAKIAASVFQKGQAVSAQQALPVYLRNDVAKKAKDQSAN